MTVTINGTTGIAGTNGSAGTPAVQGEDTNTGIFFPAADTVAVATAGAERVRVDSSGNAGLGTTSPYTKLDIVQATAGYGGWKYGASLNATDFPALRFLATTGNTGSIIAHEAGATVFLTGTTATGAGTERLRLDASGNLGLGVTPSAWGSFTAMQFGDTGCLASNAFSSSNTQTFFGNNVYYDGAYKYISTGSAAAQYIQLGAEHRWNIAPSGTAGNAISFTQAMTLDASGRLMIGTTSQDGSLTVANGSIEGPVASVSNSRNVSGDQVLVLKNGANANNTSSYYLVCQQPGVANRMFIFGNGNVVNLNNSYGALSDEKLKENIIDSGSQWDDLKAVRVRKYSLKADNADGPNQIGVIAQELEAAGMGGLVFESPDLDADKQPTGEVTKQVNYSILYMKAVKALQEAMARIETLEAKVNALEAK